MSHRALPAPRHRFILSALALSTAAIALVACGGGGTTPSTESSGEPVSGGTLRVGVGDGLICVDPHQVYSYEGWALSSAITDSLTELDPETNELMPWLAEEWEVNEDASSYTFHLRDDVTFSDGTPFTAETVRANMEDTIANFPGAPGTPVYLTGYAGTTVDDEFTVTINFSQPNPAFLIGSSTPTMAMVSESTLEHSPEERCQGDLIGTGPFVLESYTPGVGASLVRREGYAWSSDVSENDGEAYLEGVEFSIISESSVREGQVTSGQLDVAWSVNTRAVAELERSGSTIIRRTVPGLATSLMVNTLDGRVLADEAVRRALQISFDRASSVSVASNGEYPASTSVLAQGIYGWTDLSDSLAHDADAANEILDEAGWVMGDDGIRTRDGQSLVIGVVYSEERGPAYTPALSLIQEQAREVGIELELMPMTGAATSQMNAERTYDLLATNITQVDPNVLTLVLTYIVPDQELLAEEGITDLLQQSSTLPNGPDREAVLAELQQALVDSGLIVPIWDQVELSAIAPTADGVRFDARAALNFYDAWLAQ